MKELTIKSGFIDGLLIVLIAVVNFFLSFYSLLYFYGFMPGGERVYYHWEITVNAFIISLLLWLVECLSLSVLVKRRTRVAYYGVSLILLFSLSPVVFYGLKAFNYSSYFKEFNQTVWKKDECKPLNMVRYLKKENAFSQLSRAEVVEKLGEGNYRSDSTSIHYYTSNRNTCVEIVFKKDELYFYRLYWCGKGRGCNN